MSRDSSGYNDYFVYKNPTKFKRTDIRMWVPRLGNTRILCSKQLRTIIDSDYPGLKRHPKFDQLLSNAINQIRIFNNLKCQTYLQKGNLSNISRLLNMSLSTVCDYVRNANRPQLYFLIDRCFSKHAAKLMLDRICLENNGICSIGDVESRLSTYFPAKTLLQSSHRQNWTNQAKKYFQALKLFQDGGLLKVIAREINTDSTQLSRWLKGSRPILVGLARRVPKDNPGKNNQWLPTKMVGAFHPTEFIRVPLRIERWFQVSLVLKQIKSLENKNMKRWQERFGEIDKKDALAYTLGLMVSDAGKRKPSATSASIVLELSKKYQWSERFGEAACYYLGKLGIKAKRDKDRNISSTKSNYQWRSENNPLIVWLKEQCLGLSTRELTSYNPIKADWLLEAPYSVQLRFLQALNDGDGCASIRGQFFSNSSSPNVSFIRRLLASFDIESYCNKRNVYIIRQESIIRASNLPFFLHAMGRQNKANKLCEMMKARKKQKRMSVPSEVLKFILALRKAGKSYGEIAEIVFDKNGLSYSTRRIFDYLHTDSSKR